MKIIKGRNYDITMTHEYELFPYCMICGRALRRLDIDFVLVDFKARDLSTAENRQEMVCSECIDALKKTLDGDTE